MRQYAYPVHHREHCAWVRTGWIVESCRLSDLTGATLSYYSPSTIGKHFHRGNDDKNLLATRLRCSGFLRALIEHLARSCVQRIGQIGIVILPREIGGADAQLVLERGVGPAVQ
jgi:hypothetical protein